MDEQALNDEIDAIIAGMPSGPAVALQAELVLRHLLRRYRAEFDAAGPLHRIGAIAGLRLAVERRLGLEPPEEDDVWIRGADGRYHRHVRGADGRYVLSD
jgi:hypothetical protein